MRKLKQEALNSAEFRGHTLTPFNTYGTTAYATCSRCGAQVVVDTDPPANGIDIGGAAVAVNCPKLGPCGVDIEMCSSE
jgi:hypothetical protein